MFLLPFFEIFFLKNFFYLGVAIKMTYKKTIKIIGKAQK